MSTLAEIESAARQLSPAEQMELFLRLGEQLRRTDNFPEPRTFSAEEIQGWIEQDEADGAAFRAGR